MSSNVVKFSDYRETEQVGYKRYQQVPSDGLISLFCAHWNVIRFVFSANRSKIHAASPFLHRSVSVGSRSRVVKRTNRKQWSSVAKLARNLPLPTEEYAPVSTFSVHFQHRAAGANEAD